MKKHALTESGLFHVRALAAVALCGMALFFGALSLRASPKARTTSPPPVNWSVVHSAEMAPQSLPGITCLSTSDCWAVGTTTNANSVARTLIERWNGSSWTIVPSPNTNAADSNRLVSVTCVSESDCWAVGHRAQTLDEFSTHYPLIVHWDGLAWSIVASPETTDARLTDVACSSNADCWAVGYAGISSPVSFIEHWNGATWSIVNSPHPGSGEKLHGVTCNGTAECWAVGEYYTGFWQTLVERWDGSAWSVVSSPNSAGDQSNFLFDIICSSSSDCWATGTYDTGIGYTLVERWDGNAWTIVASPNAKTGNTQLGGVACPSTSDCWAVGYSFTFNFEVTQSFIAHWNGLSWSTVPPATVGSVGENNELLSVTCVPGSQCWASGDIDKDGLLIESWNGAGWSVAFSPHLDGGGLSNWLYGTACVSASDCWAVGTYDSVDDFTQTLIEHWNGNAWVTVPSPNGPDDASELKNVACTSTSDCWAVGDYYNEDTLDFKTLVEHWNGSAWSTVDSPNASFNDSLQKVACTSASDCWTVGFYYDVNDIAHTMIQHWNGAAWIVVPSPDGSAPNDNFLYGVACTSASDCWAVGYYFEAATGHALLEHWDGNTWSLVAPPNPGVGNSTLLQSVTCNSATDCWAVGVGATPNGQHTLFEHWDGSNWMIVASPNISLSAPVLNAVTCSSSTECWAVGSYYLDGHDRQPLVTRWNGFEWSIFSSPLTDSQFSSQLRGVTCTSASHCWAVGDYQSIATGLNRTLIEALTPIPGLTSVASRKTHGADMFEVILPGVECRSGGASGDYNVVFNFENTLTSVDAVSVTTGTGIVSGSSAGADPHEYVVNLTGVTNAQHLTISLTNAKDSAGNIGNSITAGLDVLIGDTNGDGSVNSADISQTKSQSGQDLTNANFRQDVNSDGSINSADISLVKSKSGTALPSSQPLDNSTRNSVQSTNAKTDLR